MILKHKKLDEENSKIEQAREILFEVASSCNCDFTGENGEEYVSDLALENHYNNDLDYYFDIYAKYYDLKEDCYSDNIKRVVSNVMDEMLRGAQYGNYEFIINENEIIIACYVAW